MSVTDEALVPAAPGVSLWVARRGRGVPFVLCHGGQDLSDYLAPLAAAVADVADVLRYDQRGRSTGDGPYAIDNHVEDLESLRRWVGCESWVVGGHSWGATLALAYALSHAERMRGLVYVSGTGMGQQWRAAHHAEAARRRGESGAARLAQLEGRQRNPDEEHEYRVLSWSPDFADRAGRSSWLPRSTRRAPSTSGEQRADGRGEVFGKRRSSSRRAQGWSSRARGAWD